MEHSGYEFSHTALHGAWFLAHPMGSISAEFPHRLSSHQMRWLSGCEEFSVVACGYQGLVQIHLGNFRWLLGYSTAFPMEWRQPIQLRRMSRLMLLHSDRSTMKSWSLKEGILLFHVVVWLWLMMTNRILVRYVAKEKKMFLPVRKPRTKDQVR